MFFDTLCGIAERHLPEFIPMLAKARIFRLESREPQSSGEVIDTWEPDAQIIENFRLPFTTIAIEYARQREESSGWCVIFSAEAPRCLRYISACGITETLIAAGRLIAMPDERADGKWGAICKPAEIQLWEGSKKSGVMALPTNLAWLDCDLDKIAKQEKGNAFSQLSARYAKDECTFQELREAAKHIGEFKNDLYRLQSNVGFGRCVIGVLSVLLINDPSAFVVEERPLIERQDESQKTIRRSADRPHYIILKPRQIRERFIYPDNRTDEEKNADDENRRKVSPHERRGHFRRLQSERFVKARGQIIWIDPIWIGPSEAIKGPNRYKVRLDL